MIADENAVREHIAKLTWEYEHFYRRYKVYEAILQVSAEHNLTIAKDWAQEAEQQCQGSHFSELISSKFAPLYEVATEGLDAEAAQALLDKVRTHYES
jgi:hypothetical protein